MRPNDFDPEKIVDTLVNTIETLQNAIQHHYPQMIEDDLTLDDSYFIDEQIFECDVCSYWLEVVQMNQDDDIWECVCKKCKQINNK